MSKPNFANLEAITPATLIVGVDIAKELEWAGFTDYRRLEIGRVIKFSYNREGFEGILASIETTFKLKRLSDRHPVNESSPFLKQYLILHSRS